MKTVTRLCLALTLTLTLSGCLDVEEEVWVRPDGAIEYRCTVDEPELSPMGARLAGDLRRRLEGNESVVRLDAATGRQGSLRRTTVDVELRSPTELGSLGEQSPGALAGFEVEHLGGGRVRVTRRLGSQVAAATSPEAVGKPRDALAELLARRVLAEHGYTLRLHAPRIVSSNGALDASGTCVEWRVAWTDAESAVLTAELELGHPALALVEPFLVLLGAAVLLLACARRRVLAVVALAGACAALVWRHGALKGGLGCVGLVAWAVGLETV